MSNERDKIREKLQETLKPIYDQIVVDYLYHSKVIYGHTFISYKILSELVKEGWKPPDNPKRKPI